MAFAFLVWSATSPAMEAGAVDYLVKGKFDGPMLARVLRYAIERTRAQQTQARYQDQTALTTIATAVSQSLQLEEMLEIAVAKVLEVTGCELAHIRLRNQATGEISLAAHRGLTPERVDALLQQPPFHNAFHRVLCLGMLN